VCRQFGRLWSVMFGWTVFGENGRSSAPRLPLVVLPPTNQTVIPAKGTALEIPGLDELSVGVSDPSTGRSASEAQELFDRLDSEIVRLEAEIAASRSDLLGLSRDAGGRAGDDIADLGNKTIEREIQMTIEENTRAMLAEFHHARERLSAGNYGICEGCGSEIAVRRLRANPRAALCVPCKELVEGK
jgi:RNA polymerase-binding protein DksA